MNKLAEKLTLEMIPDGIWHTVAEEIGVSNLIKLAELVGGANIYIPKADSFVRPCSMRRSRRSTTDIIPRSSRGSMASPSDGFGRYAGTTYPVKWSSLNTSKSYPEKNSFNKSRGLNQPRLLSRLYYHFFYILLLVEVDENRS